ncbi:MAG: PD-(D/E)XK nuclease family protein [Lachnospiraceae bacterium]|nr:PD-(D/E)XK nuclease family protein [Lachnospiraceae bacterium]
MGLQLWMGNAGSGKSYRLFKYIIGEADRHPERRYLIVVPEQFTLQTQKDIIRLHPRHGILNIDILSFKRLAYRVFEEVGFQNAKGVLIDDMGKNLILRKLVGACKEELPILGANMDRLGYITEVKSAISEFMQYRIGDPQLNLMTERAAERPLLAAKLKELHLLYNKFNEYIREQYVTTEELLDKVTDCIPTSQKIKSSVISFDGFTGFTPVQYHLIRALLENCLEVNTTVLINHNDLDVKTVPEEHELFYLSKKTIRTLTDMTKELGIERKPDIVIDSAVPVRYLAANRGDRPAELKTEEISVFAAPTEKVKNPKLIHLEANLFQKEEKAYQGPDSDDLRMFFAGTRAEEISEVALRIRELVERKKYAYHDIAVITGDINVYMPVCERILPLYDIPFFVDRNLPVLLNPFTEYIRAVLSVLSDNYSYSTVMRYLRSSMTEFLPEEVDVLDNYLIAFGIKGRSAWENRFIRKKKSMPEEERQRIDLLRSRMIEPFLELEAYLGSDRTQVGMQDKGEHFTVRRLSEALYRFIVRGRSREKLSEIAQSLRFHGNEVKAKELDQIYGKVMELLDQFVLLLGNETVSLKEYSELLDAGFDEIRIGVVPENQDYVQIGDLKRSRLKRVRALFFVGVNDGIIPAAGSKGGLVSDMDREFLAENAGEIDLAPTLRMQAYTERLYLYMLLSKPEEFLTISYAGVNEAGTMLKPSYLVKMISEMFPEIQPDLVSQEPENRVVNEKTMYRVLAERIQPFLENFGKRAEISDISAKMKYLSLFNLYRNDNAYKGGLDHILEAAFREGPYTRKSSIYKAITHAIYGADIRGSISRLEKYASCAYAHFLQYGLRLRERDVFSFEARNLGSAFHEALAYYGRLLQENGLSWTEADAEKREELVRNAVDAALSGEEFAAVFSDARTLYMRERIRRFTKRSVEILTAHLHKGRFIPERYEFAFDGMMDYESLRYQLSDNEFLGLVGRIDRVDLCEENGKVFVKVIDYKSGDRQFDLNAVYKGLDLQLPVYLCAAMESVRKREGGKIIPEDIIPAGIFYYHIDDPLISEIAGEEDSEREERLRREFRMRGVCNADEHIYRLMDSELDPSAHGRSDIVPIRLTKEGDFYADSFVLNTEDFGTLLSYTREKIKDIGREMMDGNIVAEPHGLKNGEEACLYCLYSHICGYRFADRAPNEAEVSFGRDEIIRMMREKLENGGAAVNGSDGKDGNE